MSSIQLIPEKGRVYEIGLDELSEGHGLDNGSSVEISSISTATNDGNKLILKTYSVNDNSIRFEISDEDLDLLFGTTSLTTDYTVATGIKSIATKQMVHSEQLPIGISGEIDTYLVPEIDNGSVIIENNDNRVTFTFDVSHPVISNTNHNIVNSEDNDISYASYWIHEDASNGIFRSVDVPLTEPSGQDISGDLFYRNTGTDTSGNFTLIIGNLTNNTRYEVCIGVNNEVDQSNLTNSFEVRPSNIPNAIENANITTIYNDNDVIDTSNVKLSFNWHDNDAYTYIVDGSVSTAKLLIGLEADISANVGSFNISNDKIFEYLFTVDDLNNATNNSESSYDISMLDLTMFGISYEVLKTTGIELVAQVVSNKTDSTFPGVISPSFTGYIQVKPTLNDIQIEVDLSSGKQTFTIDGTIGSEDSNGVTFTLSTIDKIFVDASNTDVLLDGSTNIIPQTSDVSYVDLSGTITATLSQLDRNGTVDGTDIKLWSAIDSFLLAKIKTPEAVDFTFNGNSTDGGDLVTTLTNLNNSLDDAYNIEAGNVKYELYDSLDSPDSLLSMYYAQVGVLTDIEYDYDIKSNSTEYWLSVRKYATLNSGIVSLYYGRGATSVQDNSNIEITSQREGPIKRTTSSSLTLDNIKVNVDISSGEQTFYFSGTIDSLEASGATLTVSYASPETTIIDASQITINASGAFEKNVTLTYDDINTNPTITAIINQPNFNGTNFDMSSTSVTFDIYAFKTPSDASATLIKNAEGNDKLLNVNYTTEDLGAMNGYDIVNLTAVINGDDASGNDLADISGAFDEVEDTSATNNVNQLVNQTISIAGEYLVDSSYNVQLHKTYKLPESVYTLYSTYKYSIDISQSGVVVSENQNPVFYMGNPEITDISINGQDIIVELDTHGTTLADNKAITLVLVAKDGLAGYATGSLLGNMGTSIYESGTIDASNGYYTTDIADTGNQEVSYTFDTSGVTITNDATTMVVVDVTNGHSAVSLSNFPTVNNNSLTSQYNSKTE